MHPAIEDSDADLVDLFLSSCHLGSVGLGQKAAIRRGCGETPSLNDEWPLTARRATLFYTRGAPNICYVHEVLVLDHVHK